MRESVPIRERIRNRILVREQRPMKGRDLVLYVTLSSLILLPAVFGLWQQNEFVRSRFEIEALRREKLAMQERYRCLRIERATLEALPRIVQEARRSGLVPREEAHVPFYVVPSHDTGQRAQGTPAGATVASAVREAALAEERP